VIMEETTRRKEKKKIPLGRQGHGPAAEPRHRVNAIGRKNSVKKIWREEKKRMKGGGGR